MMSHCHIVEQLGFASTKETVVIVAFASLATSTTVRVGRSTKSPRAATVPRILAWVISRAFVRIMEASIVYTVISINRYIRFFFILFIIPVNATAAATGVWIASFSTRELTKTLSLPKVVVGASGTASIRCHCPIMARLIVLGHPGLNG
jgi:hypothetical protein